MKGSAFIKLASEADTSYEDIYTVYGVSFIKGSYQKLQDAGKAKTYVSNESRLEDGRRYVITSTYAKREEKKISLDILFEASTMKNYVDNYEAFVNRISTEIFFLKIPSRYRVFKLVYSDIKIKQEYRNNKAIFTLELVEPNPRDRIVLV